MHSSCRSVAAKEASGTMSKGAAGTAVSWGALFRMCSKPGARLFGAGRQSRAAAGGGGGGDDGSPHRDEAYDALLPMDRDSQDSDTTATVIPAEQDSLGMYLSGTTETESDC
ncbi:uncharacterized protein LOC144946273 [Lampetra fluviatilis]